jgi:hypothetical protein
VLAAGIVLVYITLGLWQAYVRKDEPDEYYVRFGRIATVLGIIRGRPRRTRLVAPPGGARRDHAGPDRPAVPDLPVQEAHLMADSDSERQAREQISETENAEASDRLSGVTSLFDLRMVIGGLLTLYGLILTVMGVFASADAKAKAAGININLWAALPSWPAAPSSSSGPGSAPSGPATSRTPTATAPRPSSRPARRAAGGLSGG